MDVERGKFRVAKVPKRGKTVILHVLTQSFFEHCHSNLLAVISHVFFFFPRITGSKKKNNNKMGLAILSIEATSGTSYDVNAKVPEVASLPHYLCVPLHDCYLLTKNIKLLIIHDTK